VLPFEIIETLATGATTAAGTDLGEAMWRIDDLVDLGRDASSGALNWIVELQAGDYTAPPVAFGGTLYVATPDWFFALDEPCPRRHSTAQIAKPLNENPALKRVSNARSELIDITDFAQSK